MNEMTVIGVKNMLDDFLEMSDADLSEIKSPTGTNSSNYGQSNNPAYTNSNNSYQNQGQNQGNGNNNNGGYQKNNYQNRNNNNGGGGYQKGNFQKKEEVIEEPYVPVGIYIDREFPTEVKANLIRLASRLINKNIVVRYNADDMDVHGPISQLSNKKTEAFTPWKNFNNIESKHYYNTETAKHVAASNFAGWDKVPDAVKAMLARNVRLVFGDKNRSVVLCLITWSPDGASRAPEVTKDTGRSGVIIKLASTYGIPVINLAKPNAEAILEKTFGL